MLWFLGDRIEKVVSDQARQATSQWLSGVDAERISSRVALSFSGAFDAIFGTKHLSWRCFFAVLPGVVPVLIRPFSVVDQRLP